MSGRIKRIANWSIILLLATAAMTFSILDQTDKEIAMLEVLGCAVALLALYSLVFLTGPVIETWNCKRRVK